MLFSLCRRNYYVFGSFDFFLKTTLPPEGVAYTCLLSFGIVRPDYSFRNRMTLGIPSKGPLVLRLLPNPYPRDVSFALIMSRALMALGLIFLKYDW